jgi:5S rRNA maturation endonuclease (ribonuclease M5)
MKLTPEEILEINRYLFNALKQKDFDVKLSTKSGYIRNVSKFGVNSLPGICHSYFDGKQEYSYLCLEAGRVDPSDLGFYCSKEEDCALDKYSQAKQVKIDIRTYKRVIDAFVLSLQSTYDKYVKGKMVAEGRLSKVKIKLTGDAFEGKEGVLEEEKGDTLTVLVDFDDKGRKVRQYFKKENIDYIEPENLLEKANKPLKTLKEDNEVDLQLIEINDKRQLALAEYLEVGADGVIPYKDYYDDDIYDNVYVVPDKDEAEYMVLTATEAYDRAYESAKDYYESDEGSISQYHIDNFVDEDYMDRYWEDSERDSLSYLSEPELYEEAVNYDILSDSDFKLDDRGNPIFDEPISEIDSDDILEKIMEKKMGQHRNGIEWFQEMFGEKEFRDFVVEHGILNMSDVIDEALYEGFGYWIASYDNVEIDLKLSENGENVYAYRIN